MLRFVYILIMCASNINYKIPYRPVMWGSSQDVIRIHYDIILSMKCRVNLSWYWCCCRCCCYTLNIAAIVRLTFVATPADTVPISVWNPHVHVYSHTTYYSVKWCKDSNRFTHSHHFDSLLWAKWGYFHPSNHFYRIQYSDYMERWKHDMVVRWSNLNLAYFE